MSIKHVSSEELRRYIRSQQETDYVLVDVRRPEEYRRGHIPGARLLPVHELVQSLDHLPAGKALVFYCHSGGRSMAAAVMAEEEDPSRSIFNLNGGMLAWDGARLKDVPQVRLFEGQTAAQMFKTAVDLEKGAQRFYESVTRELSDQPGARVFARLAQAEAVHARTIYEFWRDIQTDLAPFEELYDQMPGEFLEGGVSLQSTLQQLADGPAAGSLRYIELALQIEYAAYDLYRVMADQGHAEKTRQAFLSLAQAEKGHMQALIELLR